LEGLAGKSFRRTLAGRTHFLVDRLENSWIRLLVDLDDRPHDGADSILRNQAGHFDHAFAPFVFFVSFVDHSAADRANA
jgi:hypothetical protein